MIDDNTNEYILLRKQLKMVKIKTNELIISYELFLKKIKDICCIDDNIFYNSELNEIFNILKCMNSNLEKIVASINNKI